MAQSKFGSGWAKPTGKLAAFLEAKKGTLLLGDIQAHMLKEHSKPSTRRQDVIHPSEVAKSGWCPKSTYERIKASREAADPFLKPAEKVGVQLLNIFDEGHSIHDKWQKRLRDMGDLWGNWTCENCGNRTKDTLYPQQCWNCNSTLLAYSEVPMRLPEYLISGHADGAVPRLNSLIEIKSVGTGTARIEAPEIFKKNSQGQHIDLQGLWRDIDAPFPAHVRQGQLYLWICQEMGLPFDQIIFLYESKFNQGAKEFVIKYDYDIVEPLFLDINRIVNALAGYLPNGEDCVACSKKNLNYPFICECVDEPIKCPYGGCKDCEPYGTKTTVRVDQPQEQVRAKRIKSAAETGGRSSRPASRIVRST